MIKKLMQHNKDLTNKINNYVKINLLMMMQNDVLEIKKYKNSYKIHIIEK